MSKRLVLAFGAASGFISVSLGAFAAHALKGAIEPGLLAAFKTGVQYQATHALALLILGLLMSASPNQRSLNVAGVAFMVGTVLFAGSLYALALTGVGVFGAITPIGGVSFLIGWAALFVFAVKTV